MRASRFSDICRRLSGAYALFLLTFFLLTCTGYESIARTKTRLFLTASAVYVLFCGAFSLRSGARTAHRRPDATAWLVLAYFALTLLSALCSPYSGTFWGGERGQGLATIGLYLASFLLLRRFFRPKRWLLDVFAAAICLFCLLGLVQLSGANPFGLFPQGLNYYDEGRMYFGSYWSTVGNVMSCGAVLSAAGGAFAAALLYSPARRRYALPLVLSLFSLAKLQAEGALLALTLGVVLLPAFSVRDGRGFRAALRLWGLALLAFGAATTVVFFDGGVAWKPTPEATAVLLGGGLLYALGELLPAHRLNAAPRPLRIFIVLLLCAAFAAIWLCETLPEGALREAHELLHGRWDDGFGSGRAGIWRKTWELVKQSPLLGGGADTLGQRGIASERYRPLLGITVVRTVDAAHNEYLNILVNQGALALAAYLGILGISLFRARKNGCAAAICGAAAVVYAIQAFFGIADCLCTPYFWLALAAANPNNGRDST